METRFFPRIEVQFKLSVMLDESPGQIITLDSGKYFEAAATDISEGGLGLVVKKYYLPKGARIELTMDGTPLDLKKEMRFKAEVRFCNNIKFNMYKCGVKFINMSEEYKEAIKKFIALHNKK